MAFNAQCLVNSKTMNFSLASSMSLVALTTAVSVAAKWARGRQWSLGDLRGCGSGGMMWGASGVTKGGGGSVGIVVGSSSGMM